MTSQKTSRIGARIADALVEYRDSRVSLEQLAARMALTWGQFYDEYMRLRAMAEAETVSGVIAWWLEVKDGDR